AEFFATICRDSAEVVAEEVVAAGAALARIRLMEVEDVAAARLAAAAAAAVGGGNVDSSQPATAASPQQPPSLSQQQQHPQLLLQQQAATEREVEAEVPVVSGVSFRCLCGVSTSTGAPHVPPATLALARIFLTCPKLLAGKSALQLGPAAPPGPYGSISCGTACRTLPNAPPTAAAAAALPAMAAVRSSARRVVVSEPSREGLSAVASDLRRNSHSLVIERVRLSPLDWVASAAASSGASPLPATTVGGGIASGYTYVSGKVRQVRDLLQIQPGGYDIIYSADPLSDLTAAAAAAAETSAQETAVAAARGLFETAGQLLNNRSSSEQQQAGAGSGKLLLLCFPGSWAASHGLGFAALAGLYGWELVVS
ncbi:hypothetical protein Agub_g14008, partial [Astrephomene gubernaculifera]